MKFIDEFEVLRGEDGSPYTMVECEECGGEGQQMWPRMYPSGHTEVWEKCEECYGEGCVDVSIIEPSSPWEDFYKVLL